MNSRRLASFTVETRKKGVGLWTFVLSRVIALAIALLSISFQTVKAGTANPVDSLRYE